MVAKKKVAKKPVKKAAKKTAKTAARKTVAKKPAKKTVKKAAPARKTVAKKRVKKAARKTSTLTRLEEALYERMVELDLLATDMGLAGAAGNGAEKPRRKKARGKKH